MTNQSMPPAHLHLRSTQDVFEDHLAKRSQGRLEEDIKTNYAEDDIILTGIDVYHGHHRCASGS
jgi:hypothetical protein